MKRSTQIICAFAFGVVFIVVMLVVAIKIPYPSELQLRVFQVMLALAAGGIAAILPGFLAVNIPSPIGVRASAALGVFVIVYLGNPASLTIEGVPTEAEGVFIEELDKDRGLVEYYWKQADVKFRFPEHGWKISTRAAKAGLGDITLEHESSKDAQIQIHVSGLDGKYHGQWNEFQTNTVTMWKENIKQNGPVRSEKFFIDGRPAFKVNGFIKGEIQGIKEVNLVYAPLSDNRLFEMHLTRNNSHPQEPDIKSAYDLIISTIKFDMENKTE